MKKDEAIFDKPTTYQDSFISIKPKSKIFYGTSELDDEYFDKVGKWQIYFISYYEFTGNNFGIDDRHGFILGTHPIFSLTYRQLFCRFSLCQELLGQ